MLSMQSVSGSGLFLHFFKIIQIEFIKKVSYYS